MRPNDIIQLFKDKGIRTAWDEEREEWRFSIADIASVLTGRPDQRLQAILARKELADEWDARGVQKGIEYAILTDEISCA